MQPEGHLNMEKVLLGETHLMHNAHFRVVSRSYLSPWVKTENSTSKGYFRQTNYLRQSLP